MKLLVHLALLERRFNFGSATEFDVSPPPRSRRSSITPVSDMLHSSSQLPITGMYSIYMLTCNILYSYFFAFLQF